MRHYHAFSRDVDKYALLNLLVDFDVFMMEKTAFMLQINIFKTTPTLKMRFQKGMIAASTNPTQKSQGG